jgi:RNA polymerase sigma-70 factor (ECF subfamily)
MPNFYELKKADDVSLESDTSQAFSVTDEALVCEFRAGNVEAFELLLNRYKKRIFKYIYFQIDQHSDAEDLTQEVFLQLYQKAQNYRQESNLSSFIYAIAKHVVFNYFRTKSRMLKEVNSKQSTNDHIDDTHNTVAPEQNSIQQAKQDLLTKALLQLNTEERQLIYLSDKEGFSYIQMSHILDVKVGTVRSRLNTARKKLLTYIRDRSHEL